MFNLLAVYLTLFSCGQGHSSVGDFPNSALNVSHLRENSFFCVVVHGADFFLGGLGGFGGCRWLLVGFRILFQLSLAFSETRGAGGCIVSMSGCGCGCGCGLGCCIVLLFGMRP